MHLYAIPTSYSVYYLLNILLAVSVSLSLIVFSRLSELNTWSGIGGPSFGDLRKTAKGVYTERNM